MAGVLTAQTAQITTASVEIRTLTISGKQVTLAVFRQLPECPPITEDGRWCGIPWGVVHHGFERLPKLMTFGNRPTDFALNVVYQVGSELKRGWLFDPKYLSTLFEHYSTSAYPYDNPDPFHENYEMVWSHAQKLPQLFIAV